MGLMLIPFIYVRIINVQVLETTRGTGVRTECLIPECLHPPVINLTTDINTNPGHGFVELVLARPNVSIIHHINGFVTLLH